MDHNLKKAIDQKLILPPFKKLSGLKIVFYKSELFRFGEAEDDASLYDELHGFLSSIWVSQSIIGDSLMLNGSMSWKYY
jgi:hypothetical protein